MITVRKSLYSVVFAAVLLCAAMPRLQTEDVDRCERRIAHADHNTCGTFSEKRDFLSSIPVFLWRITELLVVQKLPRAEAP